jgi:hypothetical protein
MIEDHALLSIILSPVAQKFAYGHGHAYDRPRV